MSQPSAGDVRDFILDHAIQGLRARGLTLESVSDDFDLLLEGVIDSFGLLDLITAVENRFGLQLEFDDLDADNMTVIGPLSRYVAAKAAQIREP
jgi:acyl carrier protein